MNHYSISILARFSSEYMIAVCRAGVEWVSVRGESEYVIKLSKIKLKLITFVWNRILSICRFVWILFLCSLRSVKAMHISIADNTKKRFHAACAICGLKMSQVITELIEQWLKANEDSLSSKPNLVTSSVNNEGAIANV